MHWPFSSISFSALPFLIRIIPSWKIKKKKWVRTITLGKYVLYNNTELHIQYMHITHTCTWEMGFWSKNSTRNFSSTWIEMNSTTHKECKTDCILYTVYLQLFNQLPSLSRRAGQVEGHGPPLPWRHPGWQIHAASKNTVQTIKNKASRLAL